MFVVMNWSEECLRQRKLPLNGLLKACIHAAFLWKEPETSLKVLLEMSLKEPTKLKICNLACKKMKQDGANGA